MLIPVLIGLVAGIIIYFVSLAAKSAKEKGSRGIYVAIIVLFTIIVVALLAPFVPIIVSYFLSVF